MSAQFSQANGQAEGSSKVGMFCARGGPFGNCVMSETNFSLLIDAKVLMLRFRFVSDELGTIFTGPISYVYTYMYMHMRERERGVGVGGGDRVRKEREG